MRPSKNKHPLAVIRTLHNMGQKEVASICGKSTRTVQSIELGNFNITEQIALKLSNYFNVDLAWLMNADPNAPILNKQGKPYDKLRDFNKNHRELLIHHLKQALLILESNLP
jgi:transcriptional regulator with XRE-family HTH domain